MARSTFVVRAEPDLIALVDAAAEQAGVSRNEWVTLVLQRGVAGAGARLTAPGDRARCSHPRTAERKLSWGVLCGDCGRKLR